MDDFTPDQLPVLDEFAARDILAELMIVRGPDDMRTALEVVEQSRRIQSLAGLTIAEMEV